MFKTRKREYPVLNVCKSVYRKPLLCKIIELNIHIIDNLYDDNVLWGYEDIKKMKRF